MKIPKNIEILGYTFKVKKAHLCNCFAEYNFTTSTIKLDKDISRTEQEEALLHEIIEIILAVFRCASRVDDIYQFKLRHSPGEIDEYTIFTECLYATLKRNKLLA